MAVRIMALVWELDLPDSDKLVLLALADAANDEGLCWPSMATLARKCSKSDRTVQASIKKLVASGHLTQDIRQGRGALYTVHPRSRFTPEAASPPKRTAPTPEAASDKPSGTIKSLSKRARKADAVSLPECWAPAPLSGKSAVIFQSWPVDRRERELEKFRDNALKKGDRWTDWDAAWRGWINRSTEFDRPGNQSARPAPPPLPVSPADQRAHWLRMAENHDARADLMPALAELNPLHAGDLIRTLPDLIREGERAWRKNRDTTQQPDCTLGVASFDVLTGKPAAFICGNDPTIFAADYEPYTVRSIRWHANVNHDALFGRETCLDDPLAFNVIRDAPRLLQQQRLETEGYDFSVVGGRGFVHAVNAAGVTLHLACEWPDKIGHRIDPAAKRIDLCPR